MRLDDAGLRRFRLSSSLLRAVKDADIEGAAALGLQDSAPRSAVLSLHARVARVDVDAWQSPRLVQVWGPRGSIYLVPRADRALFSIGLAPRDEDARAELGSAAEGLVAHLQGLPAGAPVPAEALRTDRTGRLAVTVTGRVSVVWDGRGISYQVEDPPEMDVETARIGLARRFLEVFAPATHRHFARWAGIDNADAELSLRALGDETATVNFRQEERLVLVSQIERLASPGTTSCVRLLPPGDPYLGGPDRDVIAPEEEIRAAVWPASVPPGALLVGGRLAGTWRRRGGDVRIQPFGAVDASTREAAEQEIDTMPLRGRRALSWIDR